VRRVRLFPARFSSAFLALSHRLHLSRTTTSTRHKTLEPIHKVLRVLRQIERETYCQGKKKRLCEHALCVRRPSVTMDPLVPEMESRQCKQAVLLARPDQCGTPPRETKTTWVAAAPQTHKRRRELRFRYRYLLVAAFVPHHHPNTLATL